MAPACHAAAKAARRGLGETRPAGYRQPRAHDPRVPDESAMRMKIPALTALSLAILGSAAVADEAPRTVSDYANVMTASAARLDELVTARQKAGDMAAAQRLVLAAAMTRRASDEFRIAEQNSLTDDVSGLPEPVPARIAAAVAEAAAAGTRAADDPAFIDHAQRAFNALMAVLPMKTPHPIVYGVLASDIAEAKLSADIVVYGYRLIDPVLKTAPTVRYKNSEIATVAVKDDRIEIALPPDVRKETQFAPSPCESRPGFALRVEASYAQRRGFWPLSWHSELVTTADVFVLPSPVIYTARITTSVDALVAKTATVPFEQKSELTVADCEETRAASVEVALPEGYKNLTCAAEWVDVSGALRQSGRCAVEGGALRVTGEIAGGTKVCSPDKLCTCPSSAQGFLVAKGSYQIQTAGETAQVVAEAKPLTFAAGGRAEGQLAVAAGGKLRHVALSFSRRACPAEVDAIDLNIGDDPRGRADAVSKTGAFRAVVKGDELTAGAIDAYPTALDKTP
jgi:hypothetical protein